MRQLTETGLSNCSRMTRHLLSSWHICNVCLIPLQLESGEPVSDLSQTVMLCYNPTRISPILSLSYCSRRLRYRFFDISISYRCLVPTEILVICDSLFCKRNATLHLEDKLRNFMKLCSGYDGRQNYEQNQVSHLAT